MTDIDKTGLIERISALEARLAAAEARIAQLEGRAPATIAPAQPLMPNPWAPPPYWVYSPVISCGQLDAGAPFFNHS